MFQKIRNFLQKKYFFYYLSLSTFCVPEQGGSKKAKTPWKKMFVVCMTLSEMGVGNALTQNYDSLSYTQCKKRWGGVVFTMKDMTLEYLIKIGGQ